jgi:hypothetical protein
MDQTTPDYTPQEAEAELALVGELGRVVSGQQVDVLLNAMTRTLAAVLTQVRCSNEDTGPAAEASLFAGLVINLHALVHPDPNESINGTLSVGSRPEALTPEVKAAATILCAPLFHLLTGLRMHYDGAHVANSWTSVLLNLLLEDGPNGEPGLARAQTILKDIHDGLPATYAQMQALRAMDDGANTSERGTA